MLKKYILATTFILTTLFMTGCDNKATENEKADVQPYVISNPPKEAKAGVKDETEGFIKINPTLDFYKISIDKKDKKIVWPKDKFAKQVPPFKSGHIAEIVNTNNSFAAYIFNVDEKDFSNYYDELAKSGFKFAKEKQSWENFTMYSDNIEINLRFGQDGPTVTTLRAKKIAPKK